MWRRHFKKMCSGRREEKYFGGIAMVPTMVATLMEIGQQLRSLKVVFIGLMKPVPTDLASGVRSGSGWRERKERKDRNKPKRPLLEPMRMHPMEPCVRKQAWAARPIADLGTYAYAYDASMHTHRSIPTSINRGAFYHFKGAHFHI
ncbi:hypothetical protein PIB30_037601 [Stylosanthes scabra]|uniref:Uncharacterized protein n=1 Tax=Stylosanthes scabra TaxID=79078 RepID=A0ABU6XBH2_9FABA|nr:hypothetical protein [Stylosanthes scabra]